MALTVGLLSTAALLLLLAAPVHVHLDVERDRAVQAGAHLSWLFGLVRLRLHPRAAPPTPEGQRPARRRSRLGARITKGIAGGMLRPDLRARLVAFLSDVLRSIRPRDVCLRARIGMDDPADTGQLWAILGPLGAGLSYYNVQLRPDFDGACFRFQAAGRVRLVPLQLLVLIAVFLMSPPVVRAFIAR